MALTDRANQWEIDYTMGMVQEELIQPNFCTPPGAPYNSGTRHRITRNRSSGRIGQQLVDPAPDWITPLRNQVNDLSISLGQDLAEYRQTVDLFQTTCKAIYDGYRWFKKRDVKAFHKRRRARKLSNTNKRKAWADYQRGLSDKIGKVAALDVVYGFGVKPLLGLLDESMVSLYGKLGEPTHVVLNQKAKETVTGTYEWSGLSSRQSLTVSKRAKVYLQFNRPPPQFQMGNVVSVAWELVPYSFMIDYLIPIGNYLTAIDALAGVKSIHGTVTTRKLFRSVDHRTTPASGYSFLSNEPNIYTVRQHAREVIGDIPAPPFPKWKPSGTWRKATRCMELLILARR
jgi:hypothetical protein